MTHASAAEIRRRRLIVNADDFGQSAGINEGIVRCHEQGVVTSASLMVNWPWAAAAAEYARGTPALSVGLHLDLGEWVCRNGEWTPLYQVVRQDDPSAIELEIVRQLERFRRLMRCDPAHIDSHQHVHRHEPVSLIVRTISNRLGVSCRGLSDEVSYHGEFYTVPPGRQDPRPVSSLLPVWAPSGQRQAARRGPLRGSFRTGMRRRREAEARRLLRSKFERHPPKASTDFIPRSRLRARQKVR